MRTLGSVLENHKGVGPGFDFLRLWLAISVLWFHSFVIVGTMDHLEATALWYYIYSLMPMFFALSGFLVAGSADRLSLGNFLVNRWLRIIPALAVEVLISAFIIGPLFTTVKLTEYFSSSILWLYLTTAFGWIQYTLPGVFPNNPSANVVNQSLWTVPFEIGCYALMSVVIVFRRGGKFRLALLLIAALLVVPVAFQLAGLVGSNGKSQYRLVNYAFFSRGALLFPSFLLGAYFYWCRFRIPHSRWIAVFCVSGCTALAILGNQAWRYQYALNLVSVPLLVYITAYIGCVRVPKVPVFSNGDYSYGIYLYGYTLQQCLRALFPEITSWGGHFLASLAVTTSAACFSWHYVEKPMLKLRNKRSVAAGRGC